MKTALLVFLMGFGAQGGFATSRVPEPHRICTSTSVLESLVRDLVPSDIEVLSLIGNSQDPHSFNPSAKTMAETQSCNQLIGIGLGYDEWIKKIKKREKVDLLLLGEHVAPLRIAGWVDPHLWLNLDRSRDLIRKLKSVFCSRHQTRCSFIEARASHRLERLEILEKKFKTQIDSIPKSKRFILVTHPGYYGLGGQFDIQVHAPTSFSAEGEISAALIGQFLKLAKSLGANSYFSSHGQKDWLAGRIAKEAGLGRAGVLHADNYPDEIPAPRTIDLLIEYNLQLILESWK